MLVTDFEHLDAPEDVMELFEAANLTGGSTHLSNVMMTCNWLVGRAKHADLDEQDDLYIPPSTALAGNVYKTLMSQVAAGKKHGTLNEVDGVRFPLKKSEIADLEKMGLIPMIIKFLDSVTGPGKLIEKFSVMRFEQDKNQKDKVYLDIHMIPYFPAKNFMIALTGQKGDDLDATAW
eukprot:gene8854-11253_t